MRAVRSRKKSASEPWDWGTAWKEKGQFAAGVVSVGSLLVGIWWIDVAFGMPAGGLTWSVFRAAYFVAAFGTAYSASLLARGERPQPWPSRIAAGACFLVGGMLAGAAFQPRHFAAHPGPLFVATIGGGTAFLLAIAHALCSGDRPMRLLLLAAVCGAILAYVCGPGYEFYMP